MTAKINAENVVELNFDDIESDNYLSIGEVESLLDTYRQTIYTYFKNKTIIKYVYEGKIYISKEDIDILRRKINFNKEKRKKKEVKINPTEQLKESEELIKLKSLLKEKEIEINHLKEKNTQLEQSVGESSSQLYDLMQELISLKGYKDRYNDTLTALNERIKEIDILYAEKNDLISQNNKLNISNEYKVLYEKLYDDFKALEKKHNATVNKLSEYETKNSVNEEYKILYTKLKEDYKILESKQETANDKLIKELKAMNDIQRDELREIIDASKTTTHLLAQRQLESSKEAAIDIEPVKESFFKKMFKK